MPIPDFPPRGDPCWQDPSWRTEKLRGLGLERGLIGDLTGASPNTVRLWLGDHRDVIPINALRLIIFELASRD